MERLNLSAPGLGLSDEPTKVLSPRIDVIPHGIDDWFFEYPSAEPVPCTVAAWGRISSEKGFEHLLTAAACLPRIGFKIWGITGDTERERRRYREALENQAASLDNVELDFRRDGIRGEELWNSIDMAEIVVMPSLYEPFGLINVEALARGRPVITTATAGGKYIMGAPGKGRLPYGYLVSTDATVLSDEIEEALSHFF